MKKLILLLIIAVTVFNTINSQDWVFAKQFASTGVVDPADTKVDGLGNIYVVGNYVNELSVGGLSPLPYSDGTGKEDIFIAKFDKNGNALWARQIASTKKDKVGGLAIDPGNNVYVVGGFQGDTLRFQGESAEFMNTQEGAGKYDAFIAKYDGTGSLLAADSVFWGDNVQRLLDVTYDYTKDLLAVVGQFQGELKYDSSGVRTLAAVSQKDHILARLTTGLGYVDKVVFNGSVKQTVFKNVNLSIKADTVHSYFVTGDLVGNLLDASGTVLLAAADAANMDIMVLHLDDQLGYNWGRTGGGTGYEHINSSGSDSHGNIYFSGKAESASIVIDSTASLSSAPRMSLGGQDYLLAKYNRDGNLQWFNRDGGPGTDNAYGLSVRGERLLYTGNIDNGGNVSSGFAVYNLDGNIIITDSITGDGTESGLNVTFDLSGDSTLVIGTFDGDSLKAGPNRLDNTSSGTDDGFLVKYGFQFKVFEVDKTDILCNGESTGAIEVATEFGTEPISYVWTPDVSITNTATGLSAGPYKIVATDFEGRKDSTTITLTEPAKIGTTEESITATSCNVLAASGNKSDGAVDISVTGGVGPYSYSWSGGQIIQDITGVAAGNHILTITDANSCVEVDTFTVPEPGKVGHGGSIVDPITTSGNDGAVHLNTYGGTGTYAQYGFNWTGPSGSGFSSTEDTIDMLDFSGGYDLTVTDLNSCTFDTTFLVSDSNTVVAKIIPQDITPITCKGGTDGALKVTHEGGVAPYAYAWRTSVGDPVGGNSQTVGGLPIGTYFVRVTDDNGVWGEASGKIEQPSLDISAWEDSTWTTSCFGSTDGAAFISAIGGWGKYSYLWIPGGKSTQDLTGVAAGTYNVTITDSLGCVYVHPDDIVVPSAAELTTGIELAAPVACFGGITGQLTAAPSGGSAPYNYLWDDPGAQTTETASDLSAGAYKLIVTDDNGCKADSTYNLDQPALVELVSISMTEPCFGDSNGSITITLAGGVGAYQYSLYPGDFQGDSTINDLKAGSHRVVAVDGNGCPQGGGIDSTVTLTQPESALIIVSVSTDSATNTGTPDGSLSIDASGGTPVYTYKLDDGPEQPGNSFIELAPGAYTVYVIDANSCSVSSEAVVGDKAVGIQSPGIYRLAVLYPNPSSGQFTIEIRNRDKEDMMLEIVNITGQLVYKQLHKYDGQELFIRTIDLGRQAKGTYFMRVNGIPVYTKLMIE